MDDEYESIKQFLESNGWYYSGNKFIHPHDELVFFENDISKMSLEHLKRLIYGDDRVDESVSAIDSNTTETK
ncbi:hypothetical protein O9H85_08500 [Paenibacillus filicis]|uniref:Uncharacterized protein n=1 Tax=Paenibacillus gyeongsangnamensis TaxID=3388067 RepID=A0ABT4Q6H4_9BACL|nr:hypothetical protein [Paenibacillus filicis]MCZ8512472.1 hypothetical protein [Paenibacillus filicis]